MDSALGNVHVLLLKASELHAEILEEYMPCTA